ncbi:MAG: hypothetical protein QMC60_06770 [Amylibacter sp.]|jgi:hypothetical protein|tara:strand:- start:27609 stop:28577 length:969 start_codon:yes stop_codon:yes gene_type:complete
MPIATRLLDHPIITPKTHPSIGLNIQGPSLIRVPDWVVNPLGRYYLYFADHKGSYIRLAYADELTGPWLIYEPGSLHLCNSLFPTNSPKTPREAITDFELAYSPSVGRSHSFHTDASTPHIASPDVHVDNKSKRIVMYFHGLESYAKQTTRVATSADGINFTVLPEILGSSYFRVFQHDQWSYALAMPGQLYRSHDGLRGFERGPMLFNPNMRHSALFIYNSVLQVFWTEVGHAPEIILHSSIDLSSDWMDWKESRSVEILRPEFSWEGADAPLTSSVRSTAYGYVNQLRDPAVYIENGTFYLLYAVAGESGIAIAQLDMNI